MNHVSSTALVEAVERSMAAEDWAAAKDAIRQLLSLYPQDAHLWVQLSYVESFDGRYRDALAAASRAAKARPTSAEVVKDVLARLRTFNFVPAMHEYIERLGGAKRLPIPLLLSTASQLSSVNDQGRALKLLDEAKSADPNFPPTLVARAQVLMYLARFSEASADITKALANGGAAITQAWWVASRLAKATSAFNHVEEMDAQWVRHSASPADVALLGHALHKELDDLGRHEDAWQALERGNFAKRGLTQYDVASTERLFQTLRGVTPVEAHLQSALVPSGPTPIFIIGMHRSGTTLLEQMLDGNPQVMGVGELYDFTSAMRHVTDHHCQGVIDHTIVEHAAVAGFDYAEVGRRYIDGVRWRLNGKAFFTDKLPSNFLNAGFICQALPQAKLLHMVRDPVEVCFSNLRELFSNANPYSYDQIELADYYLQYHRLMAYWRDAFPDRIFDIRYDRMVREPEAVIREVCDFCDLKFDPEMLAIGNRKRGVATASAVQVREGIQVRDVPKWKPYEAQLQPLIQRLRDGGVLG